MVLSFVLKASLGVDHKSVDFEEIIVISFKRFSKHLSSGGQKIR